MPYKVFVAGEEALAADANSYLMSQAVPRFTNAAQRTSQLTAPVLNQLSILDTRPGIVQFWSGTAWVDVPPFERWQTTGPNITVPPNSTNSDVWVNFTAPFTGRLFVQATMLLQAGAGAGNNYIPSIGIGSTPAPSFASNNQQAITVAGAFATVPMMATWDSIAAGSAVSIRWQLTVASNSSSGIVAGIYGSYRMVAP